MIQICLIDIEIHHARIRSADLGKIGITETSSDLGGPAPFLDLFCDFGIAAFHNTGDHSTALAGTVEVCDHLTDCTAGIELTQPCRIVCMFIIRSFLLLHIDQNYRYIEISYCRKHVVASRICQQLHDHEVYIGCTEFITGCL